MKKSVQYFIFTYTNQVNLYRRVQNILFPAERCIKKEVAGCFRNIDLPNIGFRRYKIFEATLGFKNKALILKYESFLLFAFHENAYFVFILLEIQKLHI